MSLSQSDIVKAPASTTPPADSTTSSSVPVSSSTTQTTTTQTTSLTTSLPPSSSTTTSSQTVTFSSSQARTTTRQPDTTVVITRTRGGTTQYSTATRHAPTRTNTGGGGGAAASSSSAAAIANNGHSNGSGGLSTGATTAIAVIIPVAVVALLIGLGIVFWRKRKEKKAAEDLRRKEMEEYNYNPHGDPTLPAIGSDAGGTQMTEDHGSGYRGWGATTASNRKLSTTLSGGHTQQLSDSGQSYGQPSSPNGLGFISDDHSSDPIPVDHNDELGALGVTSAAAGGAAAVNTRNDLHRGPSNASSAYSAGNQSEGSEEPPPMPGVPVGQAYNPGNSNGYGYGQHGPYGDGTYGGSGQVANGMPVVQDLNARRNTRIQPGGSYQQGNSGIAQNF